MDGRPTGRDRAGGDDVTRRESGRVRESGLRQLRAAQEADGLRLAPLLHLQCVV